MTQTARNYGRVLVDLGIPREDVEEMWRIFLEVPELSLTLKSPVVKTKEKQAVIDKIFPEKVRGFLKVLCGYQSMDQIVDIRKAYDAYFDEQNDMLQAVLYYVTAPKQEQLAGLKAYLQRKYKKQNVCITPVQRTELIGGFVLSVGDREEDYSILGRLAALQQKLTWR